MRARARVPLPHDDLSEAPAAIDRCHGVEFGALPIIAGYVAAVLSVLSEVRHPSGACSPTVFHSRHGQRFCRSGYHLARRALEHKRCHRKYFVADFWRRTFFAGGPAGKYWLSKDGSAWEERSLPLTMSSVAVGFGGGKYVAAQSGHCWLSADLANWTEIPIPTLAFPRRIDRISYDDGRFFATSTGGTLLTSIDGQEWGQVDPRTQWDLWGVAFGNGRLIGMSSKGTTAHYHFGGWPKLVASGSGKRLFRGEDKAGFGNGVFVLGCDLGLFWSADGTGWSFPDPTLKSPIALAFGNGYFVAVSGDVIVASVDGRLGNARCCARGRDFSM